MVLLAAVFITSSGFLNQNGKWQLALKGNAWYCMNTRTGQIYGFEDAVWFYLGIPQKGVDFEEGITKATKAKILRNAGFSDQQVKDYFKSKGVE